MTIRPGLLVLLAAASGCVLPRVAKLDLPPPHLDDPEVQVTWNVGEVRAHAVPRTDSNGSVRDYAPMKAQLEARLRETLEAQAGLGHRATQGEYEVSVELDVTEASGLSPWLGLGLGLEAGVLLAGAAGGMALGGPPGGLVGVLVATPLAVAAALAPPSTTDLGELEARLTVRRRGGEVLVSRHVRRSWRDELNGYHREQKLARDSGVAVLELERALLEELRSALKALPVAVSAR